MNFVDKAERTAISWDKVFQTIILITGREVFRLHLKVNEFLQARKFWTSGYYINSVLQYAHKEVIKKYV